MTPGMLADEADEHGDSIWGDYGHEDELALTPSEAPFAGAAAHGQQHDQSTVQHEEQQQQQWQQWQSQQQVWQQAPPAFVQMAPVIMQQPSMMMPPQEMQIQMDAAYANQQQWQEYDQSAGSHDQSYDQSYTDSYGDGDWY